MYLYVNHFVVAPGGSVRLLRTIRDHEQDCEFDNAAEFWQDGEKYIIRGRTR